MLNIKLISRFISLALFIFISLLTLSLGVYGIGSLVLEIGGIRVILICLKIFTLNKLKPKANLLLAATPFYFKFKKKDLVNLTPEQNFDEVEEFRRDVALKLRKLEIYS